MANVKNYSEMKNATAIKAQVRADVMEVITKALIEAYGEESVKKVGSNEYAVIAGIVNDKDGFPQDVCATVKPTVKEWETRKTTKKTFEKYDIEAEAEAYEIEVTEKEERKIERAKAKAEKIEKDKVAREAKKVESEENETD